MDPTRRRFRRYKLGLSFLLFLAAGVLDLVRRGFFDDEYDYYDPETDVQNRGGDALHWQPASAGAQQGLTWPSAYLAARPKPRPQSYWGRLSRPKYCRPKKHDPAAESPYKNNTVAVLVERRDTEELLPIFMHYVGNLPGWNFHVFHSDQNRARFAGSPTVRRMIAAGRLRMTRIPDDYPLRSHASVSQFLTDPWFWNSIKEEHVMIFQLDAILCSNRDRNVDDYLHYDFIGGPFRHGSVHYNGGLSLRRRSKVLAALAAHDLSTKVWAGDFEDQWFSRTLAGMPGACLPSPRVAGEFSVDLEWYPAPLGGHQVWRWHPPEKLREFEATCPEMRMITNRKHMWRNGSPGWDGSI